MRPALHINPRAGEPRRERGEQGDRGERGVTPIVTRGRQAQPSTGRDPSASGQFADASHQRSREPELRQWRRFGRSVSRRLPGAESAAAERGSLTLMLLVLFVPLVGLAGIVIDGGDRLAAAENATAVAQEAARAGVGLVDRQTAYTSGQFVVDVPAAEAAAQEYLTAAGYTGTAGPGPTPNSIAVTVTQTQPTEVLSIIGIGSFTVTGNATASLESGVTGPGQ
jgi:hypothetical protein